MSAHKHDEQIRQEIQLELCWMPRYEPGNIGIAVEAGAVTLTGHVSESADRQAAETLAGRVLGVRSVVNEIHIRRRTGGEEQDVGLARALIDAFGRGHQGPA